MKCATRFSSLLRLAGSKRSHAGYAVPEACRARTMATDAKIVYTYTDEAPMLATYALLPIIRRFTDPAGIKVELSDISVAARVLSHFPESLTAEQRLPDTLGELGELAKTPEANIIKLPNVSASIPQLEECIAELQAHGFKVPSYPRVPKDDAEKEIAAKYSKVLGSAVNPVLREGNSDRRAAGPVKKYAQNNPHPMGAWRASSRTHVAHMQRGDFFSTERSAVVAEAGTVTIELHKTVNVAALDIDTLIETIGPTSKVLRSGVATEAGDVLDAAQMNVAELSAFYEKEIDDARKQKLMVSLHLKATMMKVSDPIMFGHCVKAYFKDAFNKWGPTFDALGVNVNNGVGDVYEKIKGHADQSAIEADLMACHSGGGIAMVNSRRGITNLHAPSDVIIDASMPVVVRDSGMMWNKDDALEDVKCIIPDRCYATMYQKVFEFTKANGQFDVATMGTVPNVGLMAKKAEEYGSHPNTFEIPYDGVVHVKNDKDAIVFEHVVSKGDIWRMCQTKDAPIRDWVGLGVRRARATGDAAIFWLDSERAHDAVMIEKVNTYLKDHDTSGLDISIMPPAEAIVKSMDRAKAGLNTISVTGNVLRDYLTDLFPILELGTSAKMLSIVPMLNGGAMFETGAGGSAPKHVEQFVEEGHLRWDSLGEYLALAESLQHLGEKTNNERAKLLGKTLSEATGEILDQRQSPKRKVNELDNRGTHFHLAKHWASKMAGHDSAFSELADQLQSNEATILKDLLECQGKPQDIGGYYQPDRAKAEACMRPSQTFNKILGTNF